MIPFVHNSIYSSRDMSEIKNMAQSDEFSFERHTLQFKDLSINGNQELEIQSQPFEISYGGIINLCQTLKIPNPFATRIPTDLFIYNVNRLSKERKDEPVDMFFNQKEVLVDINTKINFYPLSTIELLDSIQSLGMSFDRIRGMFTNSNVKLEFIASDLAVLGELAPGVALQHYPTRHYHTHGNIALWTLICTNGAIMDLKGFPEEKLRLHNNKNLNTTISKFFDRLLNSAIDLDAISEKYFKLKKTPLNLEMALKYFKKLKTMFGSEEAYQVMGDKIAVQLQRFMDSENEKKVPELDANIYDMYYAITDYASNTLNDVTSSRKLQVMSGNILLGIPEDVDTIFE